MPCPHYDIKIVQRSKRQSAVAAAAYQSGDRLFSEYDQRQKSYSEKQGIVHTEILLPENAPPGYADRNTELLLLDKTAFSIEKRLVLGKKNIGSLYIDGETIYVASHDGRLFKIDIKSFEIESLTKNAHKKMFHCAGVYGDMLVTVSFPCSEITLWNKDTLEKTREINTPLKLSGCIHIENDFMYICSRNILGIDRIKLNE